MNQEEKAFDAYPEVDTAALAKALMDGEQVLPHKTANPQQVAHQHTPDEALQASNQAISGGSSVPGKMNPGILDMAAGELEKEMGHRLEVCQKNIQAFPFLEQIAMQAVSSHFGGVPMPMPGGSEEVPEDMQQEQNQPAEETAPSAPGMPDTSILNMAVAGLNDETEHRTEGYQNNIMAFPFAEQIAGQTVMGHFGDAPIPEEQPANPGEQAQAPGAAQPPGDAQETAMKEAPEDGGMTNDALGLGTSNNLADDEQTGMLMHSLSSGLELDIPVQYGTQNRAGNEVRHNYTFDVYNYRKDFPVLQRKVYGNKDLVWLDNGATTQKPQQVIDALKDYYENYNSNIHRGAHALAAEATDAFEEAREKVKDFIGAKTKDEIIFLRGTTEGINLIANTYAKEFLREGDEIIVTELEHHANIVPWQFIAKEKNLKLVVARTDQNGNIDMAEFKRLFNPRTKILAMTQASNAIGTITPIQEMIDIAHRSRVTVVVDGAQSIQHMPVNVQQLDADFFVFSGHKIFAPMGVGVVYGKKEILDRMPPWQGGGAMISDVTFEKTQFSPTPQKFEAGTPNVAGPIGLGVALEYLAKIGMPNIEKYEHEITDYGLSKLSTVPNLKLIGNPDKKIGVLSFKIDGIEDEVIGKELDKEGIAVRTGHHCAQPILRKFGYESVVRPALAFYNTFEEIDKLVDVVSFIQATHQ